MTSASRYLKALRAARPRQLRARVLRPLRRRRFPAASRGHGWRSLDGELWRSEAFAGCEEIAGNGVVRVLGKEFAFPPADWCLPGEPRLRRFHLHYGEEVLGWARRGESSAARTALEAWIAGNPPRRGDAWHPYPLSTRVGNWVAALTVAPELVAPSVVESLRRQLAYLERNVEDDLLGNHVIRNARALVLGGAALEDGALVARGLALLARELPDQVLPDGGHYERSPVYHLLVLRDLLEVRAVAGPAWLDEPIERMRRFAAALARPDGRPALFNDGSLELAPALSLPLAPGGLAVFPDTGYAVMRERDVWLAFDFGVPSPRFLPAHAHADALSFQLWIGGQPIVVDPGTFTYEAGPERSWFRSTRAHSTITVDGADQFPMWGAFRALGMPRPRLLSTDPLAAEVALGSITHRRRLRLGPDELIVEDELEGVGEAVVGTTLPLATTAFSIEQTGPLPVSLERGWLSERMLERAPIEVLHAEGRQPLPARFGWRIGLPSQR